MPILTRQQRQAVLLFAALVTLIVTAGASFWYGEPDSVTAQEAQPTESTLTPTPTATETPTETPTINPTATSGSPMPTATRSRRVANEVLAPVAGDAVSGSVSLIGTALVHSFRRYDIHVSSAGNEEWQWLTSSQAVVRDGILYHWDTTKHADGYYDLRVRAITDGGEYDETFVRQVEVRNANPPTATPYIDAAGVVRVISPLATPTPTPTATVTLESRVEGGRGIYSPQSGSVLRGHVSVIGTVNGDRFQPFARYELALSPAGLENWTWLYTGDQQVWQNELFLLDTRVAADGFYDLRLRNVFEDGNYEEYYVRHLEFINYTVPPPGTIFSQPSSQRRVQVLGFSSPKSGSAVADVVDFRGTAVDPKFLRWEMYWSPAAAETWSFLAGSDREVFEGTLARLDLGQLPHGDYDFRLRIVRQDYNYDDYHIRNLRVTEATPTPLPPLPTPTPTATSTAAG